MSNSSQRRISAQRNQNSLQCHHLAQSKTINLDNLYSAQEKQINLEHRISAQDRVLGVLAACGMLDRVRAGAAVIKSSSGILPQQEIRGDFLYIRLLVNCVHSTQIFVTRENRSALRSSKMVTQLRDQTRYTPGAHTFQEELSPVK
ncbi:pumilio [Dorcoceras hygrometricum]|uniref:Pumilio n=1 Tax=Dorcoceras hygrometricum TaxID=472368 RepID=A0A2Z7ARR9_9LAMI|nr:pumilio [Dorcoceras hygrometricum]